MRFKIWIGILSIGFAEILSPQSIEWVGPKTMDFGRIEEGKLLQGKFRFVNKSKNPVHIREVYASCGCTTTQLLKTVYDPGDTATISYTVKTKGFRGPIRKTIDVDFEEENIQDLVYVIQAVVISEIEVNPTFVNFRSLRANPDTSVTQKISIRNNGKKKIRITGVRNSYDLLQIEMSDSVIPPEKEIWITLHLRPAREETKDIDIELETDSPSRPKIMIPVFFRIQGQK